MKPKNEKWQMLIKNNGNVAEVIGRLVELICQFKTHNCRWNFHFTFHFLTV